MSISLPLIEQLTPFPNVESALDDPDGLLAYSYPFSEFSSPSCKIIDAYRHGIFPWYSDGEPVLWWSPSERAVIRPEDFTPSKSLRKHVRKQPLKITFNQATTEVITLCATSRGKDHTWITDDMQSVYIELAKQGVCQSVEVWRVDENEESILVGGLYGLVIGQVFCGESMFSLESNASKVAFWCLCDHFHKLGCTLIDCQLENEHLLSLGVEIIPRQRFINFLQQARDNKIYPLIDFQAPFKTGYLSKTKD